ncbi:hypothetical protein B0H17DRAFT_1142568 [Mycena rosella]|uniref:Uncharacterized protein n=1 Tax=Mycena rosella TaxID=1033263 RepID=A0AAD7CWT6_MYCRO|nr:hypothetical protein B0H17DRAFT_1142568 [Mycena rosella]
MVPILRVLTNLEHIVLHPAAHSIGEALFGMLPPIFVDAVAAAFNRNYMQTLGGVLPLGNWDLAGTSCLPRVSKLQAMSFISCRLRVPTSGTSMYNRQPPAAMTIKDLYIGPFDGMELLQQWLASPDVFVETLEIHGATSIALLKLDKLHVRNLRLEYNAGQDFTLPSGLEDTLTSHITITIPSGWQAEHLQHWLALVQISVNATLVLMVIGGKRAGMPSMDPAYILKQIDGNSAIRLQKMEAGECPWGSKFLEFTVVAQ